EPDEEEEEEEEEEQSEDPTNEGNSNGETDGQDEEDDDAGTSVSGAVGKGQGAEKKGRGGRTGWFDREKVTQSNMRSANIKVHVLKGQLDDIVSNIEVELSAMS
ncbi:MAG: hypothetical protein ACKPKO_61080, partial [Candidatus Fonsibacter sp.]